MRLNSWRKSNLIVPGGGRPTALIAPWLRACILAWLLFYFITLIFVLIFHIHIFVC